MTVLENAVKDDRDWARLELIPDLLKAWPEALTKAHAVVADFEVQLACLSAQCRARAHDLRLEPEVHDEALPAALTSHGTTSSGGSSCKVAWPVVPHGYRPCLWHGCEASWNGTKAATPYILYPETCMCTGHHDSRAGQEGG